MLLLITTTMLLVTPDGILVKLLMLRHCHQEFADPIIARLIELAFIPEKSAHAGHKETMRMLP